MNSYSIFLFKDENITLPYDNYTQLEYLKQIFYFNRLSKVLINEIGSLSNSFVSKLDTVSFITGYGLNTILSNIFAPILLPIQ